MPLPSQVAPSGYGRPGQIRMAAFSSRVPRPRGGGAPQSLIVENPRSNCQSGRQEGKVPFPASFFLWFPRSAWEPGLSTLRVERHDAERRGECVPTQSVGTRGSRRRAGFLSAASLGPRRPWATMAGDWTGGSGRKIIID